ncbi:MAG: DUF1673 family protein [Candidatus Methanoperedens sp.]|nr:DUF1673 family protein [Candidatus Methanoperedens sp.]
MNAIYSQNKVPEHDRIKILVDSSRDAGIISIILPASIIAFLLLLVNINYNAIDIIAISIFYFAFLILLLQNKTTVELTPHNIIIHRPLLKSVLIQKESIVSINVIKNPGYRFRWILYSFALVGLLFSIEKNITSLYHNAASSAPVIVKFITAYSIPMTTVLVAVIFYNYMVRSYHPAVLKIMTKNREITFYTNNPQELESKLEVVQ